MMAEKTFEYRVKQKLMNKLLKWVYEFNASYEKAVSGLEINIYFRSSCAIFLADVSHERLDFNFSEVLCQN